MVLVSLLDGCIGELTVNFGSPTRESNLILRRFAWAVTAAEELVAVSGTLGFHYDDGKTFLVWTTGESVDPAVWIGLFLIIVTAINMFPVRVSLVEICHLVLLLTTFAVFWGTRICFWLYQDHFHYYGHCADAHS